LAVQRKIVKWAGKAVHDFSMLSDGDVVMSVGRRRSLHDARRPHPPQARGADRLSGDILFDQDGAIDAFQRIISFD
jgi:hypothetical protein